MYTYIHVCLCVYVCAQHIWVGMVCGFHMLFVCCLCVCSICACTHVTAHINGTQEDARALARDHGLRYHGEVFPGEDVYHMSVGDGDGRRLMALRRDVRVTAVERQVARHRHKRQVDAGASTDHPLHFNDPYYTAQWYLHHPQGASHDLQVVPVWRMGITGRNVTLCVLDDGLDYSNVDILGNYEPAVSCSVAELGEPRLDPRPLTNLSDNSHGTACAAIMAAVANNGYCGVGVAFGAHVGGVRLLAGPVTDLQESLALTHGLERVDIYSASWGPRDDGVQVDGPRGLARAALRRGVTLGRHGKGAIYVWAEGNGGMVGDNCNLDGYASSRYTLSVGSLTQRGLSTFYDEPCSSTLASVYVGGWHHPHRHPLGGGGYSVVVPDIDGRCRDNFEGTSAAAPMAAGVIALVLEANPQLTWRDVQHVVVHTAERTNDTGWHVNAAGFYFHPFYGFGSLNAFRMVQAALTWRNVPPDRNYSVAFPGMPKWLPGALGVHVTGEAPHHVEHVVATLSVEHPHRGGLKLTLRSPAGTTSQLLTPRPRDYVTSGFHQWEFVSVHFWGEGGEGDWLLTGVSKGGERGQVTAAMLTLYGY